MKYRLERDGTTYDIDVELTADGYRLRGPDGKTTLIQLCQRADGSEHAITPWGDIELTSARRGSDVWAKAGERRLTARVERARPAGVGGGGGAAAGAVKAPMAGKLLRVDVAVGAVVKAGQALAIIEAMKMENELVAPLDGVVVEVPVTAPSTVDKGALIVKLEPR